MSRKRARTVRAHGKPQAIPQKERSQQGKGPVGGPEAETAEQTLMSAAGMREVVESIVVAFVLAFLFRTFEAEAFVIPTGSMAPTLMGRHKDVICPECGYNFQVSASDEINNTTNKLTGSRIISGTCPMCRYTMDLGPKNPQRQSYRSYRGDRILVTKFAYRLGDPKRWDVAVFKYPGGAKTNFIKRVIGLPNETIAISHGDLFVRPAEPEDFRRFGDPYAYSRAAPADLERFQIARKPPDKLQAMLQPVYDNDYALPELVKLGWPARWSAPLTPGLAAGWQTSDDLRSFQTDGTSSEEVWIAYHHVVPSFSDWQALQRGSMPPDNPQPQPELITDFSAYNTDKAKGGLSGGRRSFAYGDDAYGYGSEGFEAPASDLAPEGKMLGLHWVGDLAIECAMEVDRPAGQAVLALVEGGRLFQCRIDLATGKATLSIDGLEGYRPSAQTRVRGPGSYRIMFSNIDDQLLLWVDGKPACFDADTSYPRLGNTQPQPADLEPVRIGSRAASLRVRHLRVFRDVYYIAERLPSPGRSNGPITDFEEPPYDAYSPSPAEVAETLAEPARWGGFASGRVVVFPLADDQFLMLGDNSAESKDGRLWGSDAGPDGGPLPYYVRRDLLMGKATFIYWPHSLDKIPGTKIPVRFFPNFWRMHFVR